MSTAPCGRQRPALRRRRVYVASGWSTKSSTTRTFRVSVTVERRTSGSLRLLLTAARSRGSARALSRARLPSDRLFIGLFVSGAVLADARYDSHVGYPRRLKQARYRAWDARFSDNSAWGPAAVEGRPTRTLGAGRTARAAPARTARAGATPRSTALPSSQTERWLWGPDQGAHRAWARRRNWVNHAAGHHHRAAPRGGAGRPPRTHDRSAATPHQAPDRGPPPRDCPVLPWRYLPARRWSRRHPVAEGPRHGDAPPPAVVDR